MTQKIGFMDFEPILDRFPILISLRSQLKRQRDELVNIDMEIAKLRVSESMQTIATLENTKLPLLANFRTLEEEYKNKHIECTDTLVNLIKSVAEENDFAAILDIDNMLYYKGLTDVTNLVIAKMGVAVTA